jgi:cyanate permease
VTSPPPACCRTLVAAIATITIVGIGLTLTIPLLSLKMSAAGYSAGFIGLNSAVGGLTSGFCAPLVPVAARRIGMRRLLLCAALRSSSGLR